MYIKGSLDDDLKYNKLLISKIQIFQHILHDLRVQLITILRVTISQSI